MRSRIVGSNDGLARRELAHDSRCYDLSDFVIAEAAENLQQVRLYGGVWARLAGLTDAEPAISDRIKALLDAGLLKTELSPGRGDPP